MMDGGSGGAQFRYANSEHQLPNARAALYRYDPLQGTTPYGFGVVSADGRQIVPQATAVFHDFDGVCPASSTTPAGVH